MGDSKSTMSSGVLCADECLKEFEDMKIRNAYQYIVFKITDDKKSIVIDVKGEPGASFEDFTSNLPDGGCPQEDPLRNQRGVPSHRQGRPRPDRDQEEGRLRVMRPWLLRVESCPRGVCCRLVVVRLTAPVRCGGNVSARPHMAAHRLEERLFFINQAARGK